MHLRTADACDKTTDALAAKELLYTVDEGKCIKSKAAIDAFKSNAEGKALIAICEPTTVLPTTKEKNCRTRTSGPTSEQQRTNDANCGKDELCRQTYNFPLGKFTGECEPTTGTTPVSTTKSCFQHWDCEGAEICHKNIDPELPGVCARPGFGPK
jgi:hypothetical protein